MPLVTPKIRNVEIEPLKAKVMQKFFAVKTLHYAGKIGNLTADLSEFKAFSEKLGSNRLLQDKKIGFDWLPAFRFIAIDKGFPPTAKKCPDKSGLKKGEEKKELPAWRRKRNFSMLFYFTCRLVLVY